MAALDVLLKLVALMLHLALERIQPEPGDDQDDEQAGEQDDLGERHSAPHLLAWACGDSLIQSVAGRGRRRLK